MMKPLPGRLPCPGKALRMCPQSPHRARGPQALKSQVEAPRISWRDLIHGCLSFSPSRDAHPHPSLYSPWFVLCCKLCLLVTYRH